MMWQEMVEKPTKLVQGRAKKGRGREERMTSTAERECKQKGSKYKDNYNVITKEEVTLKNAEAHGREHQVTKDNAKKRAEGVERRSSIEEI